jgi:hypothetical protein
LPSEVKKAASTMQQKKKRVKALLSDGKTKGDSRASSPFAKKNKSPAQMSP